VVSCCTLGHYICVIFHEVPIDAWRVSMMEDCMMIVDELSDTGPATVQTRSRV